MSDTIDNQPTTLLGKYCDTVNIFVLLAFSAILYVLWDKQNGPCKLCEADSSPESIKLLHGAMAGASSGYAATQIVRIVMSSQSPSAGINSISTQKTLLVVTLFAMSCQVVGFLGFSQNSCVDAFGMKSSIGQWAEWQISVPFMFYLAISLDCSKSRLTFVDVAILFFAWLAIVCVFMTNWGYGTNFSTASLGTAVVVMACALTLLYLSAIDTLEKATALTLRQSDSTLQFVHLRVAQRKLIASIYLCFAFPLFPMTYLLRYSGILSETYAQATVIFLNFAVKILYSVSVIEAHGEALDPDAYQLSIEKRANESRRAFLRYVFHEVRMPLNAISLGLSLLRNGNERNSDDTEAVDMMNEATGFMTETLNDVVSVEKIEEGDLELQLAPSDIRTIIQTVQLSMKGSLAAKNLSLICTLEDSVPRVVKADGFRLEHVLANFVSNAVKFSPKNSSIYLSVKNLNPKKRHEITFSVRDEGVGISEEHQKSLFTPYMQVNAGELQQGNGTGVGLAICREIVVLHGGQVGIKSKLRVEGESQNGCGSDFFFTIPFEILPDKKLESSLDLSPESVSASAEAKDAVTPGGVREKGGDLLYPELANFKILLVDDMENTRRLFHMLLRRRGLTVALAAGGQEALQAVRDSPTKFDLILMDGLMPIMDGMEATRRLRSELGFDNLIIGITGNALDDDIRQFRSAGVDTVLTKPLQISQLDRLFQHCIEFGPQTSIFTAKTDPSSLQVKSIANITNERMGSS